MPPFPHFRDLTADTSAVDWHMHTVQTDGRATSAALLAAAHAQGLHSVAFTEHVRRETDWFPDFLTRVRAEAQAYPALTVYVGCEAKVLDDAGTLDATPALIAASDLVLGSVHRFPGMTDGREQLNRMDPAALAERECALAVALATHAPIHVLAHPGGMYQRRHGRYPDVYFRRILDAVCTRGIAIEISSSYLVDAPAFLALCAEYNPRVSLGSDVHHLDDLGKCRRLLQDHLQS